MPARLKLLVCALVTTAGAGALFHFRRRAVLLPPVHPPAAVTASSPGTASPARRIATLVLRLRQRPEDDRAREELARLYFVHRDFRAAIAELRELQSRNPHGLEASVRLAMAHNELGEHEEALRLLQVVLKRDRRHRVARVQLGETYLKQGRSDDALRTFEAILKDDPTEYSALIGKSRSLELKHESKEPVNLSSIVAPVRKAAELQPNNPTALMMLARMTFIYLVQPEEAERLAQQVLRLDADNPHPHLTLAEIYLARPTAERLRWAEIHARRAATLDTQNPEPLLQLGRVQWRLNRVQEAIESLERSLEIRSTPHAVYLLSLAHRREGNRARALQLQTIHKEWQAFLEQRNVLLGRLRHRPGQVDRHCDLAEFYLNHQAAEPARNWLHKAQRLQPDHPRLKPLRKKLEQQSSQRHEPSAPAG